MPKVDIKLKAVSRTGLRIVDTDVQLTAYALENPDGSLGFDPRALHGVELWIDGCKVVLAVEPTPPACTESLSDLLVRKYNYITDGM